MDSEGGAAAGGGGLGWGAGPKHRRVSIGQTKRAIPRLPPTIRPRAFRQRQPERTIEKQDEGELESVRPQGCRQLKPIGCGLEGNRGE